MTYVLLHDYIKVESWIIRILTLFMCIENEVLANEFKSCSIVLILTYHGEFIDCGHMHEHMSGVS